MSIRTLIGGIKIVIGDKVIDATVARQTRRDVGRTQSLGASECNSIRQKSANSSRAGSRTSARRAESRTQGTVVSVTDGICRIHGLADVMQGEMLEFPNNTFGLALNLERDSVGAVVLGEYEHITEGDTVKCTGRFWRCPSVPN